MTARNISLVLALLLAGVGAAHPAAEDAEESTAPPPDALLVRAGDYAADFVAGFSNVVAEERYEQHWRSFTRHLTSDFLLIQPRDGSGYYALRDVITIDGSPVRGRNERLMQKLTSPAGSTLDTVTEVSKESGRYSFGGVFHSPVVVIAFLQTAYQGRFRFTVNGLDRTLGPDVWEVEFTEQVHPTLLQTKDNTDVTSSGRVWIEAGTGRVLKSELTLPNDTVLTTFRFDERFRIAVPVEMVDRYRFQNYTVTGTATYGRFRRFNVATEESFEQRLP